MTEVPLWSLEDIESLKELVSRTRLLTDRYQKALVDALNRTAQGGKTDALAMVQEAYTLLPADLKRARKRFKVFRASWRRPVAKLYVSDAHGVHVSERQPYAAQEGIKFSALYRRLLIPGPRVFIGRGAHSGKSIVFRRRQGQDTGKRGRPVLSRQIKAVFTASELSFLSGQGKAELLAKVRQRLEKEARSQLDYQLRRIFDKRWGVKRSKSASEAGV